MPGEHSLISPSMIHRILGDTPCYASVLKTMGMPDKSGPDAQIGTKLHEEAERCLTNHANSDNDVVQDYVEYVFDILHGGPDRHIKVEARVSLDAYVPDMKGTADAMVFDRPNGVLHVIDLKTGSGVKVDAFDNPQLKAYALGCLETIKVPVTEVVMHIVQPPLSNFSTYRTTPSALRAFGDELNRAAMRALQPNDDYGPSESNCRFCKMSPTCPALHQVATDIVSKDFDPLPAEALTDEQLAKVVEMKPLIEQWLRGVYKHVIDRTERGSPLPHFKLVHGRSQRRWTDEAESKLVEFIGDKAFEKKLIGVTAAEKLVGKAVVDSLTTKPPGAPTLVHLDDPRPAIDIAGDFEKLEN